MTDSRLYIGIMSGTSLDGADAVVCDIQDKSILLIAHHHLDFPTELKQQLESLLSPGDNEMQRMGEVSIQLAQVYADVVARLLKKADLLPSQINCIGVHGQTVRHCPQSHFTVQLNQPALLAELTGIDIIADFRSRDMAAGGEGAPLVPAFHQAVFGDTTHKAIVNIGGIANISFLTKDTVTGFDCGPGNTLLDNWCHLHTSQAYDGDARWAQNGEIISDLLECLLTDPYFQRQPPKSTGREYFNLEWLRERYPQISKLKPVDVQRTLTRLTALGIARSIQHFHADIHEVFVCGGGVFNPLILDDLRKEGFRVQSTQTLGIHPMHVESMAFAWLAYCFRHKKAGNLPAVTHAKGPRILGALYPA